MSRIKHLLIAFCLLLLLAGDGWTQEPVVRLRESVFLDTDLAAAKKLATVEGYLRAEQWSEAIHLATQILEEHDEKLIAVGTGRYVNLRIRCHTLLATMNAEGLRLLRRRIDPRSRKWFEEGVRNRDETTLLKVIHHSFLSSYGDDALAMLGELAFERGAADEARVYWEMTLPIEEKGQPGQPLPVLTYPDTDLNRAEVRARLILCSLLQQNRRRFDRELAAFPLLHPEAQGALAGKSGRLVEILNRLGREASRWRYPSPKTDVATFALNARRNGMLPAAVKDIGAVQWSAALKPVPLPRMHRRARMARPIALSYFPVVSGGIVFLADDIHIHAYDLQTGKPAWSDSERKNAVIYPAFPPFDFQDSNTNSRAGIPRYTMTIAQGRLYARMGPPVTGRGEVNALTRSESHLVCLDIAAGQGKVQWTIDAEDVEPGELGWEFEGSPVVSEGKLYVAVRRSAPQPQSHVACYDAESGSLLWNRKVCTSLRQLSEHVHEVSHHLLTLADGMLFYSSNQGAVVALNARDGAIRWVVTYERKQQNLWTLQLKNGLTPCLYHEGLIVAAPTDLKNVAAVGQDGDLFWQAHSGGTIMAIDAATGMQKWSLTLPGGVRHLLGVIDGKVIAAGDFLWAIDLASGQIAWKRGHNDVESHSYGRGLLADGLVFWPKRESIWVLDGVTGRPRAELKFHQWRTEAGLKLTGGNLTMVGGLLLIAQAENLVAYSPWGQVKRQRKKISQIR